MSRNHPQIYFNDSEIGPLYFSFWPQAMDGPYEQQAPLRDLFEGCRLTGRKGADRGGRIKRKLSSDMMETSSTSFHLKIFVNVDLLRGVLEAFCYFQHIIGLIPPQDIRVGNLSSPHLTHRAHQYTLSSHLFYLALTHYVERT